MGEFAKRPVSVTRGVALASRWCWNRASQRPLRNLKGFQVQ